mmetsp:Transcript_80265/g.126622  ORF Transcript_80265/g.126622 Transcript_80265/m.126622 type:complete len:309 (-) Transcript_80265:31-957(-)
MALRWIPWLCAVCILQLSQPVLCSKFHTLRGVLEDHHLERVNFARRTPMKVALACAVATSIITYFLYKVYIDSMLRRREFDEDEIEELAKAAEKRAAKKETSPIERVKERERDKERKRPERKGEETGCCYNGLLRLGRGKAAASKPATAAPEASEALSPAVKRPNFSGTWSCVKAEGDLDGLYAAMGLGYFARCAMERAQWGAGQLSRTYEQQGTHVKLVQRATEETTQEFDITGTPQKVSQGDGVVIQTTSWDEREEGVLLFETKDLLGNNPNSWTTSRQYLKGDELIIEVLGARGHQAVWTYHRET